MPGVRFDFENSAGRRLSGVLETGASTPRAYVVFAHCFTCDKRSHAAVRISRALADEGFGVLRFDFTGLGESEGDFGAGLSSDVTDVVSAVEAMNVAGHEVQVLVGHSFGGAAVLAAAGQCSTVRAVAVVNAPASAEHVLRHIEGAESSGEGAGPVPVEIAGRRFELGAGFVADLAQQNQAERIAHLKRALLILHAPRDEVVGIDNATEIFVAARHPKSFVSLHDADHLLTAKTDSDYAAAVIAAWAARYLTAPAAVPEISSEAVRVEETGAGKFQVAVQAGPARFLADEPVDVGGLDSGPSPYDLLGAALGACTAMTCRLYADRKGWPLDKVSVEVTHEARTATTKDRFVREVGLEGDLDADQRARIIEIAEKCPIHRTLTEGAEVVTHARAEPAPTLEASDRGDHFAGMEEACADDDPAAPCPQQA